MVRIVAPVETHLTEMVAVSLDEIILPVLVPVIVVELQDHGHKIFLRCGVLADDYGIHVAHGRVVRVDGLAGLPIEEQAELAVVSVLAFPREFQPTMVKAHACEATAEDTGSNGTLCAKNTARVELVDVEEDWGGGG